jgi:hypothetical protein
MRERIQLLCGVGCASSSALHTPSLYWLIPATDRTGSGLHSMYRRTFRFRHSCFILSQYLNLFVILIFSQYYRQMERHERDPSKGRKATGIDLLILSLESQHAPLLAEASQ